MAQQTLEEAAEKYCLQKYGDEAYYPDVENAIKFGAKWQQERMYSEEDMKQFGLYLGDNFKKLKSKTIDEIFEQFKK